MGARLILDDSRQLHPQCRVVVRFIDSRRATSGFPEIARMFLGISRQYQF